MPQSPPSYLDWLSEQLFRSPPIEVIQANRNLCLSAAGSALFITIVVISTNPSSPLEFVALAAASLAIPVWIALALVFENYLALGAGSRSHFHDSVLARFLLVTGYGTAGFAQLLSLGALLLHVDFFLACLFLASIILSTIYIYVFNYHLGKWLYRRHQLNQLTDVNNSANADNSTTTNLPPSRSS